GGHQGDRLRLLRLHRPQDAGPDRYRRPVGQARAPAGHAALPRRRRDDQGSALRGHRLQRPAAQVRGRYPEHRRRGRPGRRRRLPGRDRHGRDRGARAGPAGPGHRATAGHPRPAHPRHGAGQGGGDQFPDRGRARARPGHAAGPGRHRRPLRPPLRASADGLAGRAGHLPRLAGLLQYACRDRATGRRHHEGAQASGLIRMSDTEPKFRAATADDVEAIVALVESAYRGDASRAGWTTEADLLDGRRTGADDVMAQITRPQSRILLAEVDGRLVACAHVAVEDGAGYFGMFSVKPTLQGGGLGKRVLAEAERIVREEYGQRLMRMTVIDVREELIAWYERRGYRRTGVKKPFPYGDERFGLPRRDDLRFEVLEKPL